MTGEFQFMKFIASGICRFLRRALIERVFVWYHKDSDANDMLKMWIDYKHNFWVTYFNTYRDVIEQETCIPDTNRRFMISIWTLCSSCIYIYKVVTPIARTDLANALRVVNYEVILSFAFATFL
jgi:hypothetical protein